MCGICGAIKNNISKNDLKVVKQMNNKLIHRGPDGEGYFNDGRVALGMRRLAIIDLESGQQPLYNEDKTIVLVANAEIYNYIELRKDLKIRGHKFRTKSDCETIIHSYEEYGEGFLKNLRGMFSFCLYDIKKKKVFLVRDRMSEKPLYVYHVNDELFFSSEMKAIIGCVDNPSVDLEALDAFLTYQYIEEPRTLIKQVNKIKAAHYLVYDLDKNTFVVKKYWDPLDIKTKKDDNSLAIRSTIRDIMKVVIRSDVPVGVSLSGGIDSSLIAILADEYYDKKIHAFTVGYPGYPANDERIQARKLAMQLNIPLHEIELSVNNFVDDFEEMVYSMDDPIGDIAAYGYYSVMKVAKKEKIPVVLNGIGADELFWGYSWVVEAVDYARKLNQQPNFLRYILRNKGKHPFLKTCNHFIRNNFVYEKVYLKKLRSAIDKKCLNNFFTDSKKKLQNKILLELFNLWLYPNCTALGDRLSMSASVELRSPFLDHKLVELVFGINNNRIEEYKLPHKQRLKKAVANIVPEEILNRSKKGFEPPTEEWQRAVIKNFSHVCLKGYVLKEGLMNSSILEEMIMKKDSQFNNFLYRLIVFEIWHKQYLT